MGMCCPIGDAESIISGPCKVVYKEVIGSRRGDTEFRVLRSDIRRDRTFTQRPNWSCFYRNAMLGVGK
jgi:hypothetical protein